MPKQLSLSERIIIERMISKDYSFASIGRNLERPASTISREVIKYRCFVDRIPLPGENDCTHKKLLPKEFYLRWCWSTWMLWISL